MRFDSEKIINAVRVPVLIVVTVGIFLEIDQSVAVLNSGMPLGAGRLAELTAVALAYGFLTHFLFPNPAKYGRYVRERLAAERGGAPLDQRENGGFYH